MRTVLLLVMVLAACHTHWDDGVSRLCSASLDHVGDTVSWDDIESRMRDARDDGTTVLFHGHRPGEVLQIATLERVLDTAQQLGLDVITYDQIADEERGALALAIDDNAVDEWYALRGLLADHGVHVTFFISRWFSLGTQQVDELMQLASDGNEIEPHTVNHLHAVDYVTEHGLDAYLTDEIDPSLEVLRAHGLEPHVLAYPFGERDDEIDAALFERVPILRASGRGCYEPGYAR